MLGDLSGLIGLPRSAGIGGPDDILRSLTIGPFESGHCSPQPPSGTLAWCQMTALPTPDPELPGPFDSLLSGLVGATGELRVRVFHQDGGMGLFFGADDPGTVTYARTLLTPAVTTVPLPGAPQINGPQAGLVFRLQAENLNGSPVRESNALLFDRLASIWGTWTVDLSLTATDSLSIMVTRRSAEDLADVASQQVSTTRRLTEQTSATTQSAPWQRVLNWLQANQEHLTAAGTAGGWLASIWCTGRDAATLARVQAALRGALADDDEGRWVAYDLAVASGCLPPVTFLTGREIARMLRPPRRSVPGLLVREAPPAHIRPRVSERPLSMGVYPNTEVEATLAVDDLEGHAFITGTTGSGKTTTVHRLLAESWNRHRIPFLVIDPVKDDYSGASALFEGGLTVVTGKDLRLDIMRAWPGEDPSSHVAQVAQAFRGSFTMPSPTPYVVTHLFDKLTLQPGGPQGSDLFDVAWLLDEVVADLGYADEATANIKASLKTRLDTLLSPARAHRFAWPDSEMVQGLLDRPAVVTLADLVDDEERSFIVLLLALAVWANARNRMTAQAVAHILVLEEAHRVLPELGPDDNPENGSARRTSSELLSSMLAEVRAYGEQIIVVDQSPGRVSSEVLRNTNLKIAHRVVHPDDQMALVGTLGMSADKADSLGTLDRGQAIISSRTEPLPQLIEVSPMAPATTPCVTHPVVEWPWPCGCQTNEDHFRARGAARQAARPMALFALGLRGRPDNLSAVVKLVKSELQSVAEATRAPVDCLAWAGLRQLIRHMSMTGAFDGGVPPTEQLSRFWSAWAKPAQTQPDYELTSAQAQAFAACLEQDIHRVFFARLGQLNWESALPDGRALLLRERARLEAVATPQDALAVLSALISTATRSHGCDPGVAQALINRVGP